MIINNMVTFHNIEQIIEHSGVYNEYHFWPGSPNTDWEYTKTLVVDEEGNLWHNGDIYTEEDIYMISDFRKIMEIISMKRLLNNN